MASITKRKGRYQVQVRRVGHPSRAKSFHYLADAKKWAIQIERDFELEPQFASAVSKQFSFFELAQADGLSRGADKPTDHCLSYVGL